MIKSDIKMKRDMDLIRAILLAVEAEPSGFAPTQIEIQGYTQEQIGYHALLLIEAGLAIGNEVTTGGAKSPQAYITRLTWSGHELLDSARENQIWNQAKDAVNKIGGATLQIWILVLSEFIKKKLGL